MQHLTPYEVTRANWVREFVESGVSLDRVPGCGVVQNGMSVTLTEKDVRNYLLLYGKVETITQVREYVLRSRRRRRNRQCTA